MKNSFNSLVQKISELTDSYLNTPNSNKKEKIKKKLLLLFAIAIENPKVSLDVILKKFVNQSEQEERIKLLRNYLVELKE